MRVRRIPEVAGVTRRRGGHRGSRGNDVTVFIHRPDDDGAALPGVLHLHGGGMVLLEAAGSSYMRWRDELAASGLVVVGVEFRNGGGKHGAHAFPAGLNDCTSALRWVIDNRARLGISALIVSGESGGGNLTLATTLKAKRDGLIDEIDGVYALCPYISTRTPHSARADLALGERGYFLSCKMMGGWPRSTTRLATMPPTHWHGRTTPRSTTSPDCRRT